MTRGMNRHGMTLLELVVGLTITGVAAAAGYGAFTSIVDQQTRAATQVDAVARAAAARQMLTYWLAGARLLVEESGPPFRGLDGVYQDLPDDELAFLTTAAVPGGASDVVVRLHIDRDTLTPEQGLTAELSTWRSTAVERIEIEPRAAGLHFRYLTRMLGRTEWLPSWISSTVLPVGVELTLVPVAGGIRRADIIAGDPVTAGAITAADVTVRDLTGGTTTADTLPSLLRLPIVVPVGSGR